MCHHLHLLQKLVESTHFPQNNPQRFLQNQSWKSILTISSYTGFPFQCNVWIGNLMHDSCCPLLKWPLHAEETNRLNLLTWFSRTTECLLACKLLSLINPLSSISRDQLSTQTMCLVVNLTLQPRKIKPRTFPTLKKPTTKFITMVFKNYLVCLLANCFPSSIPRFKPISRSPLCTDHAFGGQPPFATSPARSTEEPH